ncbi:hypothetical protein G6048_42405, partial [Streptomyces sp. YC419]|nr:hypothetical protein [Streptomyces ureilyticus]
MIRGEGADKSITGNEPLAPGDGDGRLGRAGEGSGSSSHFAVVISADGSAAVDGEPVPVMPGESVDIAILDTLHGYARSRSAAVKAAISDPSAGYVAIVEVAPDGSSRLLERRQEGEPKAARSAGPLGLGVAGSGGTEADAIPQPAGRQVTPAHSPAPAAGESSRKKARPQSDDEYEAPSLLQRPLVIGAVGVAVAALAFGSVWALGDGGAGGGDKQEQAANAGNGIDRSPMDLRPAPSFSPSTNPSPSLSPSASPSKSASASASPPPAPKPKPPEPSKSEGNSEMPKGGVLFVNKKYGFCLDLPGTGKVTANPQAHDGFCTPS